MTAPVVDPVRSAPARKRAPVSAPPRPQLRVLRAGEHDTEADQRRLVRQLAIVATVVAALCLFGVVVFHVVMTQNQFRLDALRSDASGRQAEYERLRLQVSQLESPDRVVSDAQTRLGMITPPKVTYLTPSVDEPGSQPPSTPNSSARSAAKDGTGWAAVKPLLAER